MDKILNMQLSMFGSFKDIKLETQIVIKLLNSLSDEGFIPGSVDLASVDLQTGKMTVDSRMQMISPDKTWTIVFLPDRIDFNYNYQQDTQIYKCIDKILIHTNELVEKVFSIFSATTGNRLAINCKQILENMTDGDLKQFCDRFTKPLTVYNETTYNEWTVRFNSRGNFHVSEDREEECNRITEMTQLEIQNEEGSVNHNIVVSMDINTLVLNQELRFRYSDLKCFANNTLGFISDTMNEIERG